MLQAARKPATDPDESLALTKGIKACCRQRLAEREKTIRDLIMAGEPKTGDGPILRVQLRRACGTIYELLEKNAESDRKHEAEVASLRAVHARELGQARSDNPPELRTGSTEPTAQPRRVPRPGYIRTARRS